MTIRFVFIKYAFLKCFLCAFFFLLLIQDLSAQRDLLGRDEGLVVLPADSVYQEQAFDKNLWPALKSLAFPGWGQYHHKQYHKIPVILGAEVSTIVTAAAFRSRMKRTIEAMKPRLNPANVGGEPSVLEMRFNVFTDQKKFRWAVAATGFIHLLNVTDALATGKILEQGKKHSPTKIAMRSAFVPGWGQLSNGRWWKVPIVYGGLIAGGYSIFWNNENQAELRNELFARKFDPNQFSASNPLDAQYRGISDDRLISARDFYLDQLDIAILVSALVYIVNIVDAAVDAHLRDFDIDDNLQGLEEEKVSASLAPIVFPSGGVGLSLEVNF